MAYSVYLDEVLLPVTPGKIDTRINNKNETMELMNIGEINILKDAGLSDIEFDALIPQVKYPFANYTDGFKGANYYLDIFEKLKKDKKPFQFIVYRSTTSGSMLFYTNIKVSLEDYTIKEDEQEGLDVILSIKLKHYKDYATKKIITNSDNKGTIETQRPESSNKPSGKTYTVKSNDSLWSICKSQLGDGGLYNKVYELNKKLIDSRNKGKNVSKYTVYSGQVLKLE